VVNGSGVVLHERVQAVAQIGVVITGVQPGQKATRARPKMSIAGRVTRSGVPP
jgi:hypothetical protein